MTSNKIGYCRTSMPGQHPEAQADVLTAAGCTRVFTDAGVSGKLAARPQWDACLDYLREGDALVCVKLDRIGRSLRNLLDVVSLLGDRGVDLICLDQGIDTSTAAGRMMFQVVGAMAEFEHSLIKERTLAGLAVARARGRVGGRRPVLSETQVAMARQMYSSQEFTVAAIAESLGCSRPTVYRALS